MRASVWLLILTALGPIGGAQFQGLPQPVKPEDLPPVAEVRKQIEAARKITGGGSGARAPLDAVVGWMDGEPITMDELLDEVLLRFGAPLVPALGQQELMRLEVLRRAVKLTDREFLEEVRYYLAQLPEKKPLPEHLRQLRIGWSEFARQLRVKGCIHKLVREDQHLQDPGPPNPFLLQIWAGGLRRRYQLDTAVEKLPPGVLARITGTWSLRDLLGLVRRRPLGLTASGGELRLRPREGTWPVFILPARKVSRYRDGRPEAWPLREVLALAAAGKVKATPWTEVRLEGGEVTYWPPLTVERRRAGQGPDQVPLAQFAAALLKEPFTIVREHRLLSPAAGKWPQYVLPAGKVRVGGPRGPERPLLDAAAAVAGRKGVTRAVLFVTLPDGAVCVVPDLKVAVRSELDRPAILRFLLGQLKLAQFEDALESLARFKAVKKAFAGYPPGKPRGEKPDAPWGVVHVDEKAVAARVAAERKKYAGTIFTWEVVCQILGKTVPEEIRRFWVANGVDQILGTEVDEATLKAYYEKHIDNFGVATVEAEHILFQERDPKTGRIQWEKARRKAERVLAMIRTGADFAAMAKKYSEDPQTRMKGGDLGLFALVSRYDPELCRAAFRLEPGQISPEPVRTKRGYHILRVRKKTPPDRKKYSWESEGMKEKVREAWQEERRERWLREHVYGPMHLKSRLEEIFFP